MNLVKQQRLTQTVYRMDTKYNENLKVHCADNLPEFQGGLVGYFGFDTVKIFEPNIQISSQRDLLKTPDIKLIISRDLLIFDKLKNKIHIIVISDPSLMTLANLYQKLMKL